MSPDTVLTAPKLGTYFVTGNHEYIVGGVDEAMEALKSVGSSGKMTPLSSD